MTVRFANGIGYLFQKETPDFPVERISYQLTEMDATAYTKKRWWGDFSTHEELKHSGNYLIEFEDKRRGECVVIADAEASSKKAKIFYYHFNNRGPLTRNR